MKSPMVRFTLLFFLFLLAFSLLSVVTSLQNHLHLAEQSFAAVSAWLANLAGGRAVVAGNLILVQGITLDINHECTGVFVLFVLASFIAAYPAGVTAKALGIVVGIAVLTLVNVIRIATLVRVVEWRPSAFAYFHEYVWQGAFLMLVTLYAMSWVEWARR
jgi:exosortase/archaeosortase family protein